MAILSESDRGSAKPNIWVRVWNEGKVSGMGTEGVPRSIPNPLPSLKMTAIQNLIVLKDTTSDDNKTMHVIWADGDFVGIWQDHDSMHWNHTQVPSSVQKQ